MPVGQLVKDLFCATNPGAMEKSKPAMHAYATNLLVIKKPRGGYAALMPGTRVAGEAAIGAAHRVTRATNEQLN